MNTARYHTFAESSPDSMMIVEESGKFIAMNASARNMLGYSWSEIGALDLDSVGARSIRDRLPEFRRIGRIKVEGTLVRKDGNIFATVFNTAAMGDGSFQFVLGEARDRRTRAETLYEATPVPVIELDRGSKRLTVRSVNRRARSLCGDAANEDCVGKTLTEILGVSEREIESLLDAARSCRAEAATRTWAVGADALSERVFKAHLELAGESAVLALCDITDEIVVQRELSAALREKRGDLLAQ